MALVTTTEEQTELLFHVKEVPNIVDLDSSVQVQFAAELNGKHSSNNPTPNGRESFKTSTQRFVKNRRYLFQGLPSCHRWLFHLATLFHIFLGVALLVTLPRYSSVMSSQQSAIDGFSILFFVMAVATIVLVLLMALRKFWVPNFSLFGHMPVKTVLRDSIAFGFSLVGLCYAREKNRVPCHLQDGLFFLAIPISIVYMTMKKKRDHISNREVKLMAYLTVFMSLIFIGVVPQLAYKYVCRGVDTGLVEGEEPKPLNELESLWIGVYIASIGLMSCSLSSFFSNIQDREDSKRAFEWTTWFHVFTLVTVGALFWSDIFPAFGSSEDLEDFWSKMENIWNCHFSSDCTTSSKLGFLLPVWWLLFIYMSNMLIYHFQSNPVYVICNASLAIPLLSLFYSFFQLDSVIQVKPSLTLGAWISIIVFPISYIVLSCYHAASLVLNLLDNFDIY